MLRQRASEHGDQGGKLALIKADSMAMTDVNARPDTDCGCIRVYKRRGDQNFHGNVRVLGEMCNDSVSPSPTHNVRNSKKDARIRRESESGRMALNHWQDSWFNDGQRQELTTGST